MKKIMIWLLLCFMAATTFSQSIKISALPTATGQGKGSFLPVVQNGVTKKIRTDSIAEQAKDYSDSISALTLDSAKSYADSLQAVSSDYRTYAGVLSQTSTSIPTVAIVKNSLPGTVVWTRNSAGNYTGTLAGAFTIGKTFVPTMNQQIPIADRTIFIYSPDGDTIQILVRKISDGSFVDLGQSGATAIQIMVFK